jgi:hypothetical protein
MEIGGGGERAKEEETGMEGFGDQAYLGTGGHVVAMEVFVLLLPQGDLVVGDDDGGAKALLYEPKPKPLVCCYYLLNITHYSYYYSYNSYYYSYYRYLLLITY